MAKRPVTIVITINADQRGDYRGRVVGWGIPNNGNYGSLWSIELDSLGPGHASAGEVLRGLAGALLRRLG